VAVTPPPVEALKCDRATTIRKGRNKCVCRYDGMRKISATKCACRKGRTFLPGQGCVRLGPPIVEPPQVTPLKCNRVTTVKKRNTCVCRYRGMRKVSATNCSCKKGLTFMPGRGCVKLGPPIVTPPQVIPLKCDRRSTVQRGNKCVCRKGFNRVSATRCVPARVNPPIIKQPLNPIKPPRVVVPKCDRRSTVLRGNKCACRKGFTRISPTRCTPVQSQTPPKVNKPQPNVRPPQIIVNPNIVIPKDLFKQER
jgi:hypothetical protein